MGENIFSKRRIHLQSTIANESILILFSGIAPHKSADEHYPFAVSNNFLYLTGIDRESFMYLYFKIRGQEQEVLFIEKPDPMKEKWTGYRMREDQARETSGIEKILFEEDFVPFITRLFSRENVSSVYLDLESRDLEGDLSPAQKFAAKLSVQHPYLTISSAYPAITEMRSLKSEEEILWMKKAIHITSEGLHSLWQSARPGIMEYQLEAHYNFAIKMSGAKDFAFSSIVASGPNATILHYVENHREVQDGELVLLDLGAKYEHYSADISRTFPVNGKFTERQREIYEIVLKAQLAVIEAIKPGFLMKELNELAKKVLSEELLRIGLIHDVEELSKYYYHGVSHFLGLDTHDVGIFDGPLQPGMVITVEPGLYIAEEHIGIRIEDDVLVTESGCEVLSKEIPKTIAELEDLLGNK